MAKHPLEAFGEEEEMQGSGEPSGRSADGLPGRKVTVGHGAPMDGVKQKHLHHEVHGHIAHSPRTNHK